MKARMYVRMCVRVCIYIRMFIYIYVYVCMCVCVSVCRYVCVQFFIDVHVCIYVDICVYMHPYTRVYLTNKRHKLLVHKGCPHQKKYEKTYSKHMKMVQDPKKSRHEATRSKVASDMSPENK